MTGKSDEVTPKHEIFGIGTRKETGCSLLQNPTNSLIAMMMMAAVSSSETSVNFYETTRRNVPEDSHLHTFINSVIQMIKPRGTCTVRSKKWTGKRYILCEEEKCFHTNGFYNRHKRKYNEISYMKVSGQITSLT
jgi:hypothetical protein